MPRDDIETLQRALDVKRCVTNDVYCGIGNYMRVLDIYFKARLVLIGNGVSDIAGGS